MIVSKLDDSLIVRLSDDAVETLGLKEGDIVQVSRVRPELSAEDAQKCRDDALERLRSFRGTLPADFKFNREEANER
jgi:antitoxin MazE